MAGIQSTLWAVDGGNKQLCEKLVESSKCNVLSERVTTVRKTSTGRFSVDTENTTNRFVESLSSTSFSTSNQRLAYDVEYCLQRQILRFSSHNDADQP